MNLVEFYRDSSIQFPDKKKKTANLSVAMLRTNNDFH